jgi:hypothetical protein
MAQRYIKLFLVFSQSLRKSQFSLFNHRKSFMFPRKVMTLVTRVAISAVFLILLVLQTKRINPDIVMKLHSTDKTKLILFWEPYKYYDHSILKNCRHSCKSTDSKSLITAADAVLFHAWIFPTANLPAYRRTTQRWVYFSYESPVNTFYHSNKISYRNFNGIFNWTFTYRTDSDIKMLKWSFKKLPRPTKNRYKDGFRTRRFAMALVSNCKNIERIQLIKQLEREIPNSIDFYGKCGTRVCNANCVELAKNYKFYLALENSVHCKDYITEKFWKNGLLSGAIPVVKGAAKTDFLNQNVLNGSFIHVDDFVSVHDLAEYLIKVNQSESLFQSYHSWRNRYTIVSQHVKNWCDLCDRLHEDQQENIYHRFDKWYDSCENFTSN